MTTPTLHSRVHQHVQSLGIAFTVRRHCDVAGDIRTPADFAAALGYPPARVTKSVFCRTHSRGLYAVVVAPSDQRIDLKQAAAALGAGRLEMADPDELHQLTGYPRHGVSPLGLDAAIAVVVARELLGYESVLVGAGHIGVEIEVSPLDLVDATNAKVADVAAPG